MKILMLTTNSSLMDGVNRHILNVAKALNNYTVNGSVIEIGVCTIHKYGDLNRELDALGIKNFNLNAESGHTLKIPFKFKKVLKVFKPDIVHSHVMGIMLMPQCSGLSRKIPFIHTAHGLTDEFVLKQIHPTSQRQETVANKSVSFKQKLERWFYKHFRITWSKIIYISNGVHDALRPNRQPDERNIICYNPISFKQPKVTGVNLKSELGLTDNAKIIGTACRIASVKQPEIFTNVMCEVLEKNENVHAVVIGNGDLTLIERCKSIIEKRGLSSRFHWLGYRKDAPELVADFDCFVMTSSTEGMPTSVLECFVSKTPIAMMRGFGGLTDIARLNEIHGGIVAIADRNDIHGLAGEISRLLTESSTAAEYAARAYAVAERVFGTDAVAKQMAGIYFDSLKEKVS